MAGLHSFWSDVGARYRGDEDNCKGDDGETTETHTARCSSEFDKGSLRER